MRVKDPVVSSPLVEKALFFVMCDFYIFGVNCFYGRFYLMYSVIIIFILNAREVTLH